jgi:hypothetical protein
MGVRYVGSVETRNAQQALRVQRAVRAGALAAGTTLITLLMTSPALALTRDDGDDPGPGLSVAQTLGLFVVIPVVAFLVIAGLVTLGHNRSERQKQG